MGAIEKQVAITLAAVLLLAVLGVVYVVGEPYWRVQRAMSMREHSAQAGHVLYETQGCITCHLQTGYGKLQGGVGWPLNTTQNQQSNPAEMQQRHELLYRTIDRGRGAIMAPYGRENGGPLNAEQIENIVDYIQYGDWPVAPVQGNSAELVASGQTVPGGTGTAAEGGRGAMLFTSNGCIGCHKVNGQGGAVGPDLTHIGTTAATRVPGQTAEQYIHESIVNPPAHVVEGYQAGVMPNTFSSLPPADIDELVKYLAAQK